EEQIALSSGEDVSLAVGGRLFASSYSGISLFTQQGGARLFSGQDKVEIQAQDGELEAIARQLVQVISTESDINITSPKKIVLTGGSSQLTIESNGITVITSGKFEVKASEHKLLVGQRVNAIFPELPTVGPFMKKFNLFSLEGIVRSQIPVELYNVDSKKLLWKGTTSDTGEVEYKSGNEQVKYIAIIGDSEWSGIFEDDIDEATEFDPGEHGPQYDDFESNINTFHEK
ncbi:DUF2345 domain-containing protein, partial [Acinetobacter populi]